MALKGSKHDRMLVAYLTEHRCSAKEVFLRAWNKATKRPYDLQPHRDHQLWVQRRTELPVYVKRYLEEKQCSSVRRWPSLSR